MHFLTGTRHLFEAQPSTSFATSAAATLGLPRSMNVQDDMAAMARRVQRCLLFLMQLMLPLIAHAEAPSIESVSPPVGQRGTEFDVRIMGSGLQQCRDLIFYTPGLQCKKIQVESDYELLATISADAQCPLRNEPFRLLGRDGFSELRTLRITPFPILLEAAVANQTLRIEQSNFTICGILESGDNDRFSVQLNRGQRITAEVEAVRLGYELIDTVLTISTSDGEPLLQVDDNALHQQDPSLSFVAPTDGTYFLEVHETNYEGNDSSHYALHVGDFPNANTTFPSGGKYGTQTRVQFIDEFGLSFEQSFDLPEESAQDAFQLLATTQRGPAPSEVPFRLSSLPNVFEQEPNAHLDSPSPASSSPVALNGILQEPGDLDFYAFQAEVGKRLSIEAFADRMGSTADTKLLLYDASGQWLASNDDWGSHDSRIEFTPAISGSFFVGVTDKLGRGSPHAVYRVEITHQTPSLSAFLPRPNRVSQDNQTIAVPIGNRVMKRVAVRRELVDGDVQLIFHGLPQGVHASPLIVAGNQFWVPAVLEASETAEIGASLAQIQASCRHDNRRIQGSFEQVIDLVHSTADQLFQSVTVDRLPVAVTPSVPFRVDLLPPATGLPAGGTLDLRVQVTREAGFEQPVRVALPFLPPWVVAEPHVVIPAGEVEGVFRLQARAEAKTRTWPIVASAQVDTLTATANTRAIDGREVASQLIDLSVAPPPIQGEMAAIAAEQGQTLEISCALHATGKLPPHLTGTLEGLPNRVQATSIEIDTQEFVDRSMQIRFPVEISKDAPTGVFSRLQCRLSGQMGGQQVSYVVAARSSLQIAEAGQLRRDRDGRVLSRLEALRATQAQ